MKKPQIEIKRRLDTSLLKSIGWKPRFEGKIPLWPIRGKIMGYVGKKHSSIPGFEDILLSGIAVEYAPIPKGRLFREGSVFGGIEEYESLYVWLYDQKIAREITSPYMNGVAHSITRFVTPNDDPKKFTPLERVDLTNLVLKEIGNKFWYPDIHPLHSRDHFSNYEVPSTDRIERYLSALKVLIHN